MKKSEACHLAQIAVLNSNCISPDKKLEVLRILMDEERLSQYCESKGDSYETI